MIRHLGHKAVASWHVQLQLGKGLEKFGLTCYFMINLS